MAWRFALGAPARLAALYRSLAMIEFRMDGTIVSANNTFLKAMGYSREEIIGRHHSMFVDPAERNSPGYHAFWQVLNRGEQNVALAGEFEASVKTTVEAGARSVAARRPLPAERAGDVTCAPRRLLAPSHHRAAPRFQQGDEFQPNVVHQRVG